MQQTISLSSESSCYAEFNGYHDVFFSLKLNCKALVVKSYYRITSVFTPRNSVFILNLFRILSLFRKKHHDSLDYSNLLLMVADKECEKQTKCPSGKLNS